MPVPFVSALRKRLSALGVTALFHLAIIALILEGLPKQHISAPLGETETTITLLPLLPPPPSVKKKRIPRGAAGSNAITPYFNPYTYPAPSSLTPNVQGLSMALAACVPEIYDMASDEIRTVCGRIGALVRNDPGHFGVTQDVADPRHWQTELARREAPFLAPCMSPKPPPPIQNMLAEVNLQTLMCVYDLLMHPYDPEKRARYSQ
jgi:hypothetical protein